MPRPEDATEARTVTTREWYLAGAQGRLFAKAWSHPSRDPDHLVVLVHGYAEHIGRYTHVAEQLVDSGAVVYGLDHQGHGRSAGPRVDIDDFATVVQDLHRLVTQARTAYRSIPLVVVGHSMGGMIATRYAQQHGAGVSGLVLSGPVLGPWSALTALIDHPELREAPLDASALSRDPNVATAYTQDELVWHGAFQERTLHALRTELTRITEAGSLGTLPTLWLHGSDDAIVPLADTFAGLGEVLGSDLTARVYPGARHEVFNELNWQEVLDQVREFTTRLVPD
ncbi:alpha/beta hydrolase [Lipingzhangella sp. LS1_29]|uniref:Alpha/beta hydrolase n=1 Tax=Lipingzhangella rawalii TaxID=2055835 RepID=A0ABU2H0Q8_9ACTN|nr:lysophospholipase [Lipingzhangella rawalii]MDS1268882.1 alpha/beta hydrolase [Lipingzhangella rawalii]